MCIRIRGCDGKGFVYVHAMETITTLYNPHHIWISLTLLLYCASVREMRYYDIDTHIIHICIWYNDHIIIFSFRPPYHNTTMWEETESDGAFDVAYTYMQYSYTSYYERKINKMNRFTAVSLLLYATATCICAVKHVYTYLGGRYNHIKIILKSKNHKRHICCAGSSAVRCALSWLTHFHLAASFRLKHLLIPTLSPKP